MSSRDTLRQTAQTHFDDEDLDEQLGVRGVGKGGGRAGDPDGDAA